MLELEWLELSISTRALHVWSCFCLPLHCYCSSILFYSIISFIHSNPIHNSLVCIFSFYQNYKCFLHKITMHHFIFFTNKVKIFASCLLTIIQSLFSWLDLNHQNSFYLFPYFFFFLHSSIHFNSFHWFIHLNHKFLTCLVSLHNHNISWDCLLVRNELIYQMNCHNKTVLYFF